MTCGNRAIDDGHLRRRRRSELRFGHGNLFDGVDFHVSGLLVVGFCLGTNGIANELAENVPMRSGRSLRPFGTHPAIQDRMFGDVRSRSKWRFGFEGAAKELPADGIELSEDRIGLGVVAGVEDDQRQARLADLRESFERSVCRDNVLVIGGGEQNPMRGEAEQFPGLGRTGIRKGNQPAAYIECQLREGLAHLPGVGGVDGDRRRGGAAVHFEATQAEFRGIDFDQADVSGLGGEMSGVLPNALRRVAQADEKRGQRMSAVRRGCEPRVGARHRLEPRWGRPPGPRQIPRGSYRRWGRSADAGGFGWAEWFRPGGSERR